MRASPAFCCCCFCCCGGGGGGGGGEDEIGGGDKAKETLKVRSISYNKRLYIPGKTTGPPSHDREIT